MHDEKRRARKLLPLFFIGEESKECLDGSCNVFTADPTTTTSAPLARRTKLSTKGSFGSKVLRLLYYRATATPLSKKPMKPQKLAPPALPFVSSFSSSCDGVAPRYNNVQCKVVSNNIHADWSQSLLKPCQTGPKAQR
jgi:hypothetical protein